MGMTVTVGMTTSLLLLIKTIRTHYNDANAGGGNCDGDADGDDGDDHDEYDDEEDEVKM